MSSSYLFTNRSQLDTAVDLWISDETSATNTYGDINTWDVSTITDFSGLFFNEISFNSDISDWDVSSGTNFTSMFEGTSSFNQDISNWDVSSGTNFSSMFYEAISFKADINV